MSAPLIVASACLALSGAGVSLYLAGNVAAERRRRLERFAELVRGAPQRRQQRLRDVRGWLQTFGAARVDRAGSGLGDAEVPLLLARAGRRGRDPLALFAALQALMPLAALSVTALFWVVSGRSPFGMPFVTAAFAALAFGYMAPKRVLGILAARRCLRIREEVPALVHVLRILFECGLSVEQALLVISTEHKRVLPEVGIELGELGRMVSAGSALGDATKELARELDLPEVTDLLGLVRQIDRYGGEAQRPLAEFAELLSDRRRTELLENVNRMSAKMTVVMVVCLLPALLAFLAGPGFVGVIRALRDIG